MENVKNFISKKIITLQGEKIGYILNILFDKEFKNFKGFIVVDEESQEEFLLKDDDIFSRGEDCLIIENSLLLQPLILLDNFVFLGKETYTCDGVNLGRVEDVVISKCEVKKIICQRAEVLPKQILASGECVIVGRKKPIKKGGFPKVKGDGVVRVVGLQRGNEEMKEPIRVMGNINKIIGKSMRDDLLGLNNEMIAKKGERITKNIIDRALLHGKGNLLLFLSE